MGEELFSAYHSWRETFQGSVLPRLLREPGGWLDDDLLRAALDDAIERTDGKTWGEIHRLLIAHPLASIPGLEPLFTAADIPFGGDEQTVAQGGFDGSLGFRLGGEFQTRFWSQALYTWGDPMLDTHWETAIAGYKVFVRTEAAP